MKNKNKKLSIQYGLGGAVQGAQMGMKIGGAFGPVGMGVGALLGGVGGHFLENNMQNKQQLAAEQAAKDSVQSNYNTNPFGTLSMADGGLTLNNPLINIELDELMVDRASGEIIEDYSTERGFKPHGKTKEDMRNFVPAQENGVIIPKKYSERYRNNKELRQGILRDVINKYEDRILYGVDADGNKVEFSQIEKDINKMSKGGYMKKYALGGPTKKGGFYDPTNPSMGGTNPTDLVSVSAKPFDSSLLRDPITIPEQINGLSVPMNGNNKTIDPNANLWTFGNTMGAIGTGVAALGPLATTLANGIDKNENNYYSGVSTRAEGNVSDMFRGVERRGVRDINLADNVANNLNRNRSTNFGSMLANAQNVNRGTQRNIADFFNQVGAERAKIMADLNFRGDMANAQGLTARDERLDMNRDNFYSNLSSNLSNAGVNMQGMGRNLNQHYANNVRFNSLRDMFPDFEPDVNGNLIYKGNK